MIYKGELFMFVLAALVVGWMAGSWFVSRSFEQATDPIELVTFEGFSCRRIEFTNDRACSFRVRAKD